MGLDVTNINTVESLLLGGLTNGFSLISIYAQHLLYYFIIFEIIFSGFAWALYQSQYIERLFGQLLKIGLILFIVQNFTSLLNNVLASILFIGQQLAHNNVQNILLNPGIIWEYGYNFGVNLLQVGSTAEGVGLPLIFTILGFGILSLIAIFAIQILLQVVAFYWVAGVGLLFLPLSVFNPLRDFFSQTVKNILRAAVRLMIQMLLVSTAITVWSSMHLQHFETTMNINTPLGFLFSALLFVLASFYLPRMVDKVIGDIKMGDANHFPPSSDNKVSFASSDINLNHSAPNPAISVSAQTQAMLGNTSMPPMFVSPATATISAYQQSLSKDFLARQISKEFAHISKEYKSIATAERENTKKIKQAFYEVLQELKEQEKKEKQ